MRVFCRSQSFVPGFSFSRRIKSLWPGIEDRVWSRESLPMEEQLESAVIAPNPAMPLSKSRRVMPESLIFFARGRFCLAGFMLGMDWNLTAGHFKELPTGQSVFRASKRRFQEKHAPRRSVRCRNAYSITALFFHPSSHNNQHQSIGIVQHQCVREEVRMFHTRRAMTMTGIIDPIARTKL